MENLPCDNRNAAESAHVEPDTYIRRESASVNV